MIPVKMIVYSLSEKEMHTCNNHKCSNCVGLLRVESDTRGDRF